MSIFCETTLCKRYIITCSCELITDTCSPFLQGIIETTQNIRIKNNCLRTFAVPQVASYVNTQKQYLDIWTSAGFFYCCILEHVFARHMLTCMYAVTYVDMYVSIYHMLTVKWAVNLYGHIHAVKDIFGRQSFLCASKIFSGAVRNHCHLTYMDGALKQYFILRALVSSKVLNIYGFKM